jgi:hypothetical protein
MRVDFAAGRRAARKDYSPILWGVTVIRKTALGQIKANRSDLAH